MPIINHHNLLSCQGLDDLHWEQCVRLLLVNPAPQLVNLQTYVNKIIENILAHPTEEKYLKLRYNNATLQKNIFSINGGQELLLSIGFQFDIDPVTNEKFLIFPILPMMSLEKNQQFHQKLPQETQETTYSEYIDRLQSCEQWLQNTISVCLQLQQTKKESLKLAKGPSGGGRDFEEIPADSIIQLQLPTSKSAIGGFMKGDTFFDVWKFACSYFTPDRHDLVELRLPHEPHNVLKEDYSQTIVELGFLPRTKFIVTALDANQMENSKLVKGRAIAVEAVAVDRKKLYDEKMKKKEEQLAKENERKRAIQAFKDDRLERKLKGSIPEDDNKEEDNPSKFSSSTALTIQDARTSPSKQVFPPKPNANPNPNPNPSPSLPKLSNPKYAVSYLSKKTKPSKEIQNNN